MQKHTLEQFKNVRLQSVLFDNAKTKRFERLSNDFRNPQFHRAHYMR